MRHIHSLAAACLVLALHAVDDPVLDLYHFEEQVRIVSWGDIQTALVAKGLTANDANEFQIQVDPSTTTVGTSDYLRANSTDAVVTGTTRVIKAGSPTPPTTTNALLWRPLDDDFSILPGPDDTPDYDAIVVATVRVFQGPTQIGGDWVLRAHVKGVEDVRTGVGGYYNFPPAEDDLTQPLPISVPQGGTFTLTYQQIAAMCDWTDKERDGYCSFWQYTAEEKAFPSANTVIDNLPLGSPDGMMVMSAGLRYGGRLTVTVPPQYPVGVTDIARFAFGYDPDGPFVGVPGVQTFPALLRVNVTASGGTGSGGDGGGGGGCGAGTVGGLILAVISLGRLRRRRHS